MENIHTFCIFLNFYLHVSVKMLIFFCKCVYFCHMFPNSMSVLPSSGQAVSKQWNIPIGCSGAAVTAAFMGLNLIHYSFLNVTISS